MLLKITLLFEHFNNIITVACDNYNIYSLLTIIYHSLQNKFNVIPYLSAAPYS